MKILIVYCHPNPKSFCHAILETLIKQLKELKHEVVVRDLYALKFNPVLSGSDFMGFKAGKPAPDIAEEQKHLAWCDAICFINPIWWLSVPAMLKGYIDRCFSMGFAYLVGPSGVTPNLKKKVLVLQTHGQPKEVFEKEVYPAMLKCQDWGILGFTGCEVIEHKFFGAVPYVPDEVRKGYLTEVEEKTKTWFK